MFSLIWGPTLAAVSVILDNAADPGVVRRALDALLLAARMAAFHQVGGGGRAGGGGGVCVDGGGVRRALDALLLAARMAAFHQVVRGRAHGRTTGVGLSSGDRRKVCRPGILACISPTLPTHPPANANVAVGSTCIPTHSLTRPPLPWARWWIWW